MKRFALMLGIVMACIAPTAALATHTEGPPECETIVDEPGYTVEEPIQRYSFTGGPDRLDENGVPLTLPPSEDWQANTTTYNDGTSHGGNLGLYFVSHGGSGQGDWFYWEVGLVEYPPVTHEECHDATPSPTVDPTPDPTDDPTWSPTFTPEPPDNGTASPDLNKDLAETGISGWAIAGLAAFLMAGLSALAIARRRMS